MYKICGPKMAMESFADCTTVAPFGDAGIDWLVRV